jgi:hypothetical protein
MKRIKPIYLIIIIFILVAIVTLQYRDNVKIRTQQGGLVQNNILMLQTQLKFDLKYFSSTKIPQKEYIDRANGRFSGDTTLLNGIMYSPMPLEYLSMITIDLSRMSSNIKNKEPEKELIATKQLVINKITVLLNEINYIRENCKTNNIKYYQLSKSNNSIMTKVDKEMLDYLNKNHIH